MLSQSPQSTQASARQSKIALNQLRLVITDAFEAIANNPGSKIYPQTRHVLEENLGYRKQWLTNIPETAIASFAGIGNPFIERTIIPGEKVIDVGCGAGMDSLIAAKMAGSDGWVVGIDMTCAMLEKALLAAEEARFGNVDFRFGFAEDLHMPDGWADVVISNGVISLLPDKATCFREMARVLRPGGRIQIADILVDQPVPEALKRRSDLWAGRVAGALSESELRAAVIAAGFVDFKMTRHGKLMNSIVGIHEDSTFRINLHATKAPNTQAWRRAWAQVGQESLS
ncbi:methyltransferase domain-containing protein [bacterium]|nr:methyltransferase domain-containing protein [bacterium]